MKDYVSRLFAGSTTAVSGVLYWLMFYMAKYPDIQRKVYQEIDTVLGMYNGMRIYRIQFSVPVEQSTRSALVYIGFRIYRINFAVRRDLLYPSSTVLS